MRTAFGKSIFRSIAESKKRFFSIVMITALGVTMLIGIYAACQDMYLSADRFYDGQSLFDVRVVSTLGLTQKDVAALSQVEGVVKAEGGYADTVHVSVDGAQKVVELSALSREGLNVPFVVKGRLPLSSGEVAVTQKYLKDSGRSIGDLVTIEDGVKTVQTDINLSEVEPGLHAWELQGSPEMIIQPVEEASSTDVNWNTDVDTETQSKSGELLTRSTYTITGVIIDPMNTSNDDETKAFRSTSNTDYYFYISPVDVDSEVYTAVYLQLDGLKGLSGYSTEYSNGVQKVVDDIEQTIRRGREAARYTEVISDGQKKLADAARTMKEKFSEADGKFADAWRKLKDGKQELNDGIVELTDKQADARQKFKDAREEIQTNKEELQDAEIQLTNGEAELDSNARKIKDAKAQLAEQRKQAEASFAQAEAEFTQHQAELDGAFAALNPSVDGLKSAFSAAWPSDAWKSLVDAASDKTYSLVMADPTGAVDAAAVAGATGAEQTALAGSIAAIGDATLGGMTSSVIQAAINLGILNGSQRALDDQKAAFETQKASVLQQLDAADAQIRSGEAQIKAGRVLLAENKQKVKDGWQDLYEGQAELNQKEADAEKEFADAWQEIADKKVELADGESKLRQNELEYLNKKVEARVKLADAMQELADVKPTTWYVQDRSALDSYSSMKNEMSSIESLGKLFPIIFLSVAILISLTTMTRMVDEERGLIGTYKALGLSDWAIYQKYLLYALLASVLGSALGNVLGFVFLPKYLMSILQTLYTIPYSEIHFYVFYGVGSSALFILGIVGATALACHSVLRQMPATLLRPKAPRPGSRVLLERIPFIWNRLSFLNKVTARNLFRYTRRLIMTIAGIMGCTVLLLIGFTIHDTVTQMVPNQYDKIYRYQMLVVSDDNEKLNTFLQDQAGIQSYLNVQMETVKVVNLAGEDESMQMVVVPAGGRLSDYVLTPDAEGTQVTLPENGILLTQNAADLLNVKSGDTVSLQNTDLEEHSVGIAAVVNNYLGNNVYVSQQEYEALFGQFKPNAAFIHLNQTVTDAKAYAADVRNESFVLSSISTEALRDNFIQNFSLLNAVVLLLIVLAAGLAFLVLFTLSNTNISERVRELATIKVLGFFDNEVHSYVNKEMFILTLLGVLIGLPVGRIVAALVIGALKFPSVNFALTIDPLSYVYSALISIAFAILVGLFTNRSLDQINMVEALKSVE
jgi:putative ABC transport system permease protein